MLTLIAGLLVSATISGVPAQLDRDDYGGSISPHGASDLFFSDTVHGTIAIKDSSNGQSFLLETRDAGETWNKLVAPNGIDRLFFLDAERGWALKSEANKENAPTHYLLRTSDGGRTWGSTTLFKNGPDGAPLDLAFNSQTLGWVVGVGQGGSCMALKTTDGGISLQGADAPALLTGSCARVSTVGKSDIWVYGNGRVIHSSDSGATWENALNPRQLGLHQGLLSIGASQFFQDGHAWLAGQDENALILHTADRGQHWSLSLDSKAAGNFSAISFWDLGHGCAVSFYPVLLFCTNDGGATWNARDVLPPAKGNQTPLFTRLVLLKSGLGWALRAGGYLYGTSDGGLTWREVDPFEPGAFKY